MAFTNIGKTPPEFVHVSTPCINPEEGRELLDYYFHGTLGSHEAYFKNHLCDCKWCLENVEAFKRVAQYIKRNPGVLKHV